QFGASYTFGGAIGMAPEYERGPCGQNCQEYLSGCMMANVNTAGVHVSIWLDSDNPAIGWGRSPSYPNQEGSFFGNIFVLNRNTGKVDAFYCDGIGFAAGVVKGRLGDTGWTDPFQNPFGEGQFCKDHCTPADIP